MFTGPCFPAQFTFNYLILSQKSFNSTFFFWKMCMQFHWESFPVFVSVLPVFLVLPVWNDLLVWKRGPAHIAGRQPLPKEGQPSPLNQLHLLRWFWSETSLICFSTESACIQVTVSETQRSTALFASVIINCDYSTSANPNEVLVTWRFKSFCKDPVLEYYSTGKVDLFHVRENGWCVWWRCWHFLPTYFQFMPAIKPVSFPCTLAMWTSLFLSNIVLKIRAK